ncbi:hypothetical protein KDW_63760 [Dictyobacter vulcani]|uniref:Uncharacterized protein n=1 Tax=Dictyobacter vulcani TaxID=2607529 RepID=A0A5J4KS94_9CHLR|nr:hypothetical protein [Dictyobacter vulcani]GER92214.1 hypothetical protein KDW_63760 [Dictyobacter vulcani]
MFRNLQAIEIAEGALLADIAVAFQFLVAFLPVGSGFFSVMNCTVFTILVLRRGIYVELLAMCVALFLVCILIGPHGCISLVSQGLGGAFLGLTMKHRFHYIPITLLGALAAATYLFLLTIGVAWLTGIPFDVYVHSLHHAYEAIIPIVALVAQRVGLGSVWQQNLYPQITLFSQWIFTYWALTFYCALLIVWYSYTKWWMR